MKGVIIIRILGDHWKRCSQSGISMWIRISPSEQAIHQIGVNRNVEIVELGELDLERSIKVALEDSSTSWFQK